MTRKALFISHANPEDNAFALWLGSRLSAAGYEVWADLLRLRGGHDWQRRLEGELRNNACKVLFVGTQEAVQKQGVRNEIQIADEVSKRLGDSEFVIPLRLASYEAPFLIAHAQYIDFKPSWHIGLVELLDTLENTYQIPRSEGPNPESQDHWRAVQLRSAKTVVQRDERLVSNWLQLSTLPECVTFFDFPAGIHIPHANERMRSSEWPLVPYHRGFLSFAKMSELAPHFGPELPLVCVDTKDTKEFLNHGWPEYRIGRLDARNQFSSLTRQGLERVMAHRGLQSYEMANGELAWWPSTHSIPVKQLQYRWPSGFKGRRQLTGFSGRRKLYWHYGVSLRPRVVPFPHIRLVGRVIFSENGTTPIESPARMHRLRRSFCRSWRNAKWRDMLLTFLSWLSDGDMQLAIPMGRTASLFARLPVALALAPFSFDSERDKQADIDSIDELDIGDPEDLGIDEDLILDENKAQAELGQSNGTR